MTELDIEWQDRCVEVYDISVSKGSWGSFYEPPTPDEVIFKARWEDTGEDLSPDEWDDFVETFQDYIEETVLRDLAESERDDPEYYDRDDDDRLPF